MGCAASNATNVVEENPPVNGMKKAKLKEEEVISSPDKDSEDHNMDLLNKREFRQAIKSVESDPNIFNQTPVLHNKTHVQKYEGEDGISNLSLTSNMTANDHAPPHTTQQMTPKSPKKMKTKRENVPKTESELILEKALKELSKSLYESNSKMYTPNDTADNTETGVFTDPMRVQSTIGENGSGDFANRFAVLDIGSGFCKAGCSGDEDPSFVMPTIIGRSKDGLFDEALVGNVAKLRKDEINITHPVKRGVCVNWDDMEKVYDHLINMELKLDLGEHGVAMVDTISTRDSRQKLTEILFEKMNAGHFYLGNCGTLSCQSLGQSSGLVLSMGHEVTACFPVYNGNVIQPCINYLNIGGSDVISALLQSLHSDTRAARTYDMDMARRVMERHCYVRNKTQTNFDSKISNNYKMPNGKELKLNKEQLEVTELLFKKHGNKTIVDLCREAYTSALKHENVTNIHDMMRNVVLVGGLSKMQGMEERISLELKEKDENFNVVCLPKRQYAAWRGASVISSLTKSKSRWMTKDDYDEYGSNVVHRKYV